MPKLSAQEMLIVTGVIIGLAVLWWAKNAAIEGLTALPGVIEAAPGAIVQGASNMLGVPETDFQKCVAACNAGNSWDASFYCTAPQFLAYATHGTIPSAP
jgi:hypothetical protein